METPYKFVENVIDNYTVVRTLFDKQYIFSLLLLLLLLLLLFYPVFVLVGYDGPNAASPVKICTQRVCSTPDCLTRFEEFREM